MSSQNTPNPGISLISFCHCVKLFAYPSFLLTQMLTRTMATTDKTRDRTTRMKDPIETMKMFSNKLPLSKLLTLYLEIITPPSLER